MLRIFQDLRNFEGVRGKVNGAAPELDGDGEAGRGAPAGSGRRRAGAAPAEGGPRAAEAAGEGRDEDSAGGSLWPVRGHGRAGHGPSGLRRCGRRAGEWRRATWRRRRGSDVSGPASFCPAAVDLEF